MGSEVVGFDENYSKQYGSMSGGKRKSKSKRSNGHKHACGCPVCKNMRKGKKGGVLLVGGSMVNPEKYAALKAAFDKLNTDPDTSTDADLKIFTDALNSYVTGGQGEIDQELSNRLDNYILKLNNIDTILKWNSQKVELDQTLIDDLGVASVAPEDTVDGTASNSESMVGEKPDLAPLKTSLEGVKSAIDIALGVINGMAGGVSYYHGGKKSKKVGRKSKKSGRKSKRR